MLTTDDSHAHLLVQTALEYAALGLRVVPLHSRLASGACSCPKGQACKSVGKHPRVADWQHAATCDEEKVVQWWDRWPTANVGVRLGEASGIIDLECDSPEAERDMHILFGGQVIPCPTFSGARGKHRLFKWSLGLPAKAVYEVGRIEVRVGNSDKGAQSVFPPSIHGSGHQYAWLPGCSLNEIEPPLLPPDVLAKLVNLAGMPLDERAPLAMDAINARAQVPQGERNTSLYSKACSLWNTQFKAHGLTCFEDPNSQTEVFGSLAHVNKALFVPPLSDEEVLSVCNNARTFVRGDMHTKRKEFNTLSALGLEFRDGEWSPGAWRTEYMDCDPPEITLYAPFFPKKRLAMPIAIFRNPNAIATAIAEAACVEVDDGVIQWSAIWKGYRIKGQDGAPARCVRGLRAKLIENDFLERINSPPETKRQAVLAQMVLEKLIVAKEADDASVGTGNIFTSGGFIFFSYEYLYRTFNQLCDKVLRPELSKLCTRLEATRDPRKNPSTGRTKNYMKISAEKLSLLSRLAEGLEE